VRTLAFIAMRRFGTSSERLSHGFFKKEAASSGCEPGGRDMGTAYSSPRFLNDSSIFLSTCRRTASTLKLAGLWLGG
jgi:hypothetical protein